MNMGFNRKQSIIALERNYNDTNNSAEWLFDDNNIIKISNNEYSVRNDPKLLNCIPNEAKHMIAIDSFIMYF